MSGDTLFWSRHDALASLSIMSSPAKPRPFMPIVPRYGCGIVNTDRAIWFDRRTNRKKKRLRQKSARRARKAGASARATGGSL